MSLDLSLNVSHTVKSKDVHADGIPKCLSFQVETIYDIKVKQLKGERFLCQV